jgi:hypothetical protein
MIIDLPKRTDGEAALARYIKAYEEYSPREIELVRKLGARALASGAAVLGIDPRSLGWALADGQIATLFTGGERHVPGDLVERRLETAIACVAGWAELEARRLRTAAGHQADRLSGLAEQLRRDYGIIQRTLYVEATSLRQMPTTHAVVAPRADSSDMYTPSCMEMHDVG